jgi:hypothetical protein
MIGEVLYPLNQLALIAPSAANDESKKYEGRKHLMAVRLPILNCLWNDVVHLSPVHPSKIKQALLEAGFQDVPIARSFFMIDPEALIPSKAVHFKNSTDTAAKYDFPESDFSAFEHAQYQELPDIPKEQRSYFVRIKAEGGRPLLMARTPHVFYQGEINIRRAEVIQW